MSVSLLHTPAGSWLDSNGDPLSGGKIYVYQSGTTTAKDSYPTRADAEAGTNANVNPVILDASGRAQIWIDGQAKIVVKDSADATIATYDAVGGTTNDNLIPVDYVGGLTATTDAGDPLHDINISAGAARDASDSEDMVLATEITKKIDAGIWAVGDDAAGMDTSAAIAANTDYYIWLIKRTDTNVVDVLFSLSATSPTLPTASNYDKKALIGRFVTDASSNIDAVYGRDVTLGGVTLSKGLVSQPSRPAFLAYNSATDANVTGNSITATVDFDTEVYDDGDNFAADTFTAPVTGRYHFDTAVHLTDFVKGTNTRVSLQLSTSNGEVYLFDGLPEQSTSGTLLATVNGSADVDMDADDTATISVTANGGSQVVGVYGSATRFTFFSGHLIE